MHSLQRLPSFARRIWVYGAWHEAVICSPERPPASTTRLGRLRSFRRRTVVFPSIDHRMSAVSRFEMTVSTHCRRSSFHRQCLICSDWRRLPTVGRWQQWGQKRTSATRRCTVPNSADAQKRLCAGKGAIRSLSRKDEEVTAELRKVRAHGRVALCAIAAA